MRKTFLLFLITTIIYSCTYKQLSKTEYIFEVNDSINLFAFIGKKISVREFDPNVNNRNMTIDSITKDTIFQVSYVMDNAFNAKYKVIQNVFNDIQNDTIVFEAYDHYGRPSFETYKYVLLYISKCKKEDCFYHQKYQYDPVKKVNGKWKGLKGESIKKLFKNKKNGVLKARGLFKEN